MSRRSSAESQQSTKRLRFKRSHASLGISLAILLGMLAVPIAAVVGTSPASATTVPSSQGTDFWLTFESNYEGGTSLFLFISGDTATTGTVSDPAIDFSTTFSVTPGTTTTVDIPSNAEIDSSDSTVADGAVHVTAGAPVSAYGLNTYPETTDGFLGLPTSILGTSYIAEGYEGGGGSQFAVVGTQDGTTVTITPSDATGAYTAGVPYTETLNAGDVYQLIDSSGGDLSGTTVTSNLPVAVFAGNNCADVPTSDGYCNTLAEEMTPTDTWGSDFLTEPLATRSGDTFRFMASENNTTVDVDGSPVATLSADQFYETILTSASSITANNPIQVMQYSNGQDYDNQDADPMDITIPPTEQFLNSYTIATEPSGADPAITQNYLNIVAPTSETSSIDLDGTALPSSDFSPISGSSYSGAQVAVDFGSHTVNAALPFGLSVYGYGGYDAYGYPGGFTLSPIATVAGVALAPHDRDQSDRYLGLRDGDRYGQQWQSRCRHSGQLRGDRGEPDHGLRLQRQRRNGPVLLHRQFPRNRHRDRLRRFDQFQRSHPQVDTDHSVAHKRHHVPLGRRPVGQLHQCPDRDGRHRHGEPERGQRLDRDGNGHLHRVLGFGLHDGGEHGLARDHHHAGNFAGIEPGHPAQRGHLLLGGELLGRLCERRVSEHLRKQR